MMPLSKRLFFLCLAATFAVAPLLGLASLPMLPAQNRQLQVILSAPCSSPADEFAPEALDNFGYQDSAQVLVINL
jgi:hypothetical protein